MTSFFSYFVFFLVVEKICKSVPLSGKEQPKNYRKIFLKDIKGSSSKLQIEEKEREATEKEKRIEQKKGERRGNNSNTADKSQNRTTSKNWKSPS